MSWIDRNEEYKGRNCIVCGKHTRQDVAPIGIVSGRFPCCHSHTDDEVMRAYMRWVTRVSASQDSLPLFPPS
jgi:hypothetical protein